MRKEKVVSLVIVVMWVLPQLASGSADFDENLIVDFNDLYLWTDYWLYDYVDNQQCESWDLNDDGQIDLYDLDIIAELWVADYNFADFAYFSPYWRRTVDYRFMDTRFDLSPDGLVDFGDFSAFAAEWMTTPVSCCDDNSMPPVDPLDIENWQFITFTGIGGCDTTGCLIDGPDYSNYKYDDCGNSFYVVCKSTADLGGYCGYNFYFNIRRVGLCVYICGQNYFWVLKNRGGCRILHTRHITRDVPPQDPACYPFCDLGCDEQTYGYYNWQTANTNFRDPNSVFKTLDCREGYFFDPNFGGGWSGPCKIEW